MESHGSPSSIESRIEDLAPDFLSIVDRDPACRNWLPLIASLDIDSLNRRQPVLWNALLSALPAAPRSVMPVLANGRLRFEKLPNVKYVTGFDLPSLVLSFPSPIFYANFLASLGYRNSSAGCSLHLDPEIVWPLLGIDDFSRPMRSIDLIVVSEQPVNHIPAQQVVRHESLHGVDVLRLDPNDEGIILNEMVATIGECATPELDQHKVVTAPGFWLSYIAGFEQVSPEFCEVFGLKGDVTNQKIAFAIVEFIKRITAGPDNSKVVRMLMSCRDFAELLEKVKVLMPDDFVPDGKAESPMPTFVHQMIQQMKYYYSNWPGAYQFQPRSVSSLWQQEPYAKQAMEFFLINNEALSKVALVALSAESGFNFDLQGDLNFRAKLERVGSNYRVTVSW